MEINILEIQKMHRTNVMTNCLLSGGEIVIYDILSTSSDDITYVYSKIKIEKKSTSIYLLENTYDNDCNLLEIHSDNITTINNTLDVNSIDCKVKGIYADFDKRRQKETDYTRKSIMVLRS